MWPGKTGDATELWVYDHDVSLNKINLINELCCFFVPDVDGVRG